MGGDKFKYKPKRGNIRNEKASTYQIGPKQGRMQNIDVNQRTIPKKSEDGSDQFYEPNIKRYTGTAIANVLKIGGW